MTDLPNDLRVLLDDLRPAARRAVALRRRRTRVRAAAALAAVAVASAGIAVAGDHWIGEPAPDYVQRFLAFAPRFEVFTPSPLRGGRVAALSPHAILYAAHSGGNALCSVVVVGGGKAFGVACMDDADVPVWVNRPVEVDGTQTDVPVTVSGRVSAHVSYLEAVLPDGAVDPVATGADRFFLYEVGDEHAAAARTAPIVLRATLDDGRTIETTVAPPVPVAALGTPVRRVTGTAPLAGAARVEVTASPRIEALVVRLFGPKPKRLTPEMTVRIAPFVEALPVARRVAPVGPDGRFDVALPALSGAYVISLEVRDARGQTLFRTDVPDARFWSDLRAQGLGSG